MIGPCGQIAIVVHGEIYNYVEIRRKLESLGHRRHELGRSEPSVATDLI